MPIKYKMDVLAELKKRGFSSYRIRNEKIMGEATLQKIRNGELVSYENLERLCKLLGCQPGDIIAYEQEEV